MHTIQRMTRRAADRILQLFVPGVEAAAIICHQQYMCDRDAWGAYKYTRTCCEYPSGYRCGNWSFVCKNCC